MEEAAGDYQTEKSHRPGGSSLFRKDTPSWGLPFPSCIQKAMGWGRSLSHCFPKTGISLQRETLESPQHSKEIQNSPETPPPPGGPTIPAKQGLPLTAGGELLFKNSTTLVVSEKRLPACRPCGKCLLEPAQPLTPLPLPGCPPPPSSLGELLPQARSLPHSL